MPRGRSAEPLRRKSHKKSHNRHHSNIRRPTGVCKVTDTNEECLKKSITALNLEYIESDDDGNCLFYSIEHWFKEMGIPMDDWLKKMGLSTAGKGGSVKNSRSIENHMKLRNAIINYMAFNKDRFIDFIMEEDGKYRTPLAKKQGVTRMINRLYENAMWDSQFGDIVPLMAAEALNIRIVIHEWSWRELQFKTANLSRNDAGDNIPIIHILRTNGNHFDLLFPIGHRLEVEKVKGVRAWDSIKATAASPNIAAPNVATATAATTASTRKAKSAKKRATTRKVSSYNNNNDEQLAMALALSAAESAAATAESKNKSS